MSKIHFNNHQQIIINALMKSEKKVLIAVAWLNFDFYECIFKKLVDNGVKVKIIVNDDFINNRHNKCINRLIQSGVKIKKIRMFNKSNYMHHKFCIIDRKKILIGSFNWSKNASNNFENLMELEQQNIIIDAEAEFNYLWNISKKTIKLQKKLKCESCSEIKYNIMILHENENFTEYKIVSICNCDDFVELKKDYLDVSLYNSIIGTIDFYNEQIEQIKEYPEQIEVLISELNYDLLSIYSQLQEDYNIKGIGVIAYNTIFFDGEGEWYTKIIWKDRFADLEEEYHDSFNLI
ncbi:phospholipase D-like domain-containing protein [Solibacillus sp. NPDC093137]|uniref:phospholipase D-like domain-containing protein n=1 Tax=Solibacillus sp. NPDC093137 TaxID=3390678 RepID=UPI003D060747